jgi:phosphocarrier protein HPr
MRKASVKVVNRLGLHARAAAKLVRTAAKFKSTITLAEPNRETKADAKSILGLLNLSASMGKTLLLKVEGEDEILAVQEIVRLFEDGFGEL